MEPEERDPMPAITRHVERIIANHERRMHPPKPVPTWLYPPRIPLGEGDQCLSPSAEELRAIVRTLDTCERHPLMLRLVHRDGSPWLEFDIATGPEQPPGTLEEAHRLAVLSRPDAYSIERFALWRYTLDVYRIDATGAVEDDPIEIGSRE